MSSDVQENTVKRVFRNPKNRQTKVHLIFDEKARREYLTGFRKRKAERKKKYEEKVKKEMKEERKRLQTELRAKIKKSSSNRCVPEIEHLIEAPHVFELPEHTVTISAISDDQFRDENVFLGNNSASLNDSNEECQTLAEKKKEIKEVNRMMVKKLQKTKLVKRQVQKSRDKSRKKSTKMNKGKSKKKRH